MATDLDDRAPERPATTVLVVEDDPILRYMLATEIRQAGYIVREAVSVDEAETVLETGAAVDLVITDIEMPGPRDGLALAKMVRAFRPHTKVIVASGLVQKSDAAGEFADAFFGKPYDVRRILRRIEMLLGREVPGRC